VAIHELQGIISRLTAAGKGIFAADESQATLAKRFAAFHIESNVENRRSYRELLLTTPGIEAFINGVILHEETLGQRNKAGLLFPKLLEEQGILPGIKVDKGLIPLNAEEKITQGLDDLADRLIMYKDLGTCFAKWRAIFVISSTLPSTLAQINNAQILARYASMCQQNGMIPIVEPEVLMDGDHSLARCAEVTESTLRIVFEELQKHRVLLNYIVLKPNMVTTGSNYLPQASVTEVANATLEVLRRTVPADVPSIHFLSGGQDPELATLHLNEMNKLRGIHHPWRLSFSYGRALQAPSLNIWNGKIHNVEAAQRAFYKRTRLNAAACLGKYYISMETENHEAVSVV